MQPAKFVVVAPEAKKDEWINSRIDMGTTSKKLRMNLKTPQLTQRDRLIESKLKLTDRGFRTQSIISSNESSWLVKPKVTTSIQLNDSKGFTMNRNVLQTAQKSRDSSRQQRIFTSFSKRRSQSEQRLRSSRQETYLSTTIDKNKLRQKITHAELHKKRVVNAIQINYEGIRWKLDHCFVEIGQTEEPEQLKQSLKQIRTGLKFSHKCLYLFHLNRQPISSLSSIHRKQYSIFVHRHPRLEISVQVYFYLSQQIKVLETAIKDAEIDLGIERAQITTRPFNINLSDYVDQLIDDPQSGKTNFVDSKQEKQLTKINDWYDEGMREICNTHHNHEQLKPALNQKSNPQSLRLARLRLEQQAIINNPHKFKQPPITLLLETIKHEKPPKQFKSRIRKNVEQISHQPRAIHQQLLRKNKELFTQNIPYIMEKYNVSRVDAHDLYNLYKCLEHVSANRLKHKVSQVLDNGIDRKTFDEGVIGLGINIAEQVLKNICQFDDFINWPQFLKVVSISASKTPQEKLNAILNYVKDSQSEYLSRLQVDILVSTSLNKFLGKADEQAFSQMKDYFMEIIFREMDPLKHGRIHIEQLKTRILTNREPGDLISFLFLASQS